jgi:microcystin-dependent protein
MSNQYLGEIRMFGGNFAIKNWALCNGQTMSIQQNAALFSLLGTTFGGNGSTTFLLPDLQCRLPVGQGTGPGLTTRVIGENAGTENVTLTLQNLPMHNHMFNATTGNATFQNISNTELPGKIVTPATGHFYTINTGTPAPTMGSLNSQSIGFSGNGQPHPNLMPSLCVSFIIALLGIYPSRP